ncbi:hypothetical protein [Microbacterium sp.]|uniref:hypothetical protein n=1 Tax=Microbacterium sp. TaxID=51671 RepID=UPI003A895171
MAAAEATYRAYVDTLNAVDLADPATFEPMYAYMTGPALDDAKVAFSGLHAAGGAITGESIVTLVQLTPQSTVSEAELLVCLDVSEVDLVDSQGNSHVTDDRPALQSLSISLTRHGSGWLINSMVGREGPPECE